MNTVPSDIGPGLFLRQFLAPLAELLVRQDVTDIYVNRPGEIWAETLAGVIERHAAPALDETIIARLARQIAALAYQGINSEHPLLSATLPDGTRVQVIAPPAALAGHVFAFRKHVVARMSLDDQAAAGTFDTVRDGASARLATSDRLRALYDAGDIAGLLREAVKSRRTILISGGTSSGKTTFLNSLIAEIDPRERLITIEDTAELHVPHANAIGLIAARGGLSQSSVDTDDLVTASLRMRPDRIILGELRGPEAYAFLRAINTGHPGSMTTIHANSPVGAIEQMVMLVLKGGIALNQSDIRQYTLQAIDIIVQLGRVAGRRRVEEVLILSE